MANTHDYSIANDTGSAVRTDLNTLFTEVEATNAGATAPANLATGKLWYDTANNLLKQYNGSAWVVVQSGATPDIGTPSAGVVTNLSGVLPVGVTGGSGLDAVSPANLASGVLPVGVTGGSGLDAVSPANLASGVLPVGVTGGSGLDAVSPANLASGVLPVGVTGGSGLTALGTVTSGVLEDAVTYRNIDQDLATTDAPTFAGATINGAVSTRSGGASIIEKCYHQAGSNNTAAVITISTPSSGYLSATIEANLAGFQGGGHYRGHIYMNAGNIASIYTTASVGGAYAAAPVLAGTGSGTLTVTWTISTNLTHATMHIKMITGNHTPVASAITFAIT